MLHVTTNRSYNGALLSRAGTILFLMVLMVIFSPWSAEAQKHRAKVIDADGTVLSETQGSEAIHPDDSLALVAFYYAMQGDYWLDNSGWLTAPVDQWVGVEEVQNVGTFEDPEWRVTVLRTIRFNMTRPGYFPAEIGDMEYLRVFRIQRDRVTGGIPVEVEKMTGLTQWQTHANYSLTGEVPWNHLRNSPDWILSIWHITRCMDRCRIQADSSQKLSDDFD